MTEMIREPHIRMLYTLAEADESALQLPLPSHLFGFVTQESCEKLMKALISAHDSDYPFTHRLEMLADILLNMGERLPELPYALKYMEPFAIEMRYQTGPEVAEAERVTMRASVATPPVYVLERILDLERRASAD